MLTVEGVRARSTDIPIRHTRANEEELRLLFKEVGAEEALRLFSTRHSKLPASHCEVIFSREVLPLELDRLIREKGEIGIAEFRTRWETGLRSWTISIDEVSRISINSLYKGLYRDHSEPHASQVMDQLFPSGVSPSWSVTMKTLQGEVKVEEVKRVVEKKLGMSALFAIYEKFAISPEDQRDYERIHLVPLIEKEALKAFESCGPEGISELLDQLELPSNEKVALRVNRDLTLCEELRSLITSKGSAGVEQFRSHHSIDDMEWDTYFNPHVRIPMLGKLIIKELESNGCENIAAFRAQHFINDDGWELLRSSYIEPFLAELSLQSTVALGWEAGLDSIIDRYAPLSGGNPEHLASLRMRSLKNELNQILCIKGLKGASLIELKEHYKLPDGVWDDLLVSSVLPALRAHLKDLEFKFDQPSDLDDVYLSCIAAALNIHELGSPDCLLRDKEVRQCCISLADFVERNKPSLKVAGMLRGTFKLVAKPAHS